MARVLGLDVGSSSVGWALVDEAAQEVVGLGVRVFPEGVARDKQGGELSRNEDRRIARGMRRQVARRARRRRVLREALIEASLLPSDLESQRQILALDPYHLRARALTEPVSPSELGRILLHLGQRRGFLSNRKSGDGDEKKQSETLAEMNKLAAEMGDRTLGQHLSMLQDEEPGTRLRGRHTRRSMLLDEFDRIWDAQRSFHPDLLTDALRYGERGPGRYPTEPVPRSKSTSLLKRFGLHGLLFFHRALYWPRSVLGKCPLERGQRRCPRADRRAQRFRMLQEVNNLRITADDGRVRSLDDTERAKLIGLLAASDDVSFDTIRKKLSLPEGTGFNLERGERKKLKGLTTDVLLAKKKWFDKRWSTFDEAQKNTIVEALLDEEDEGVIARRARDEWGCSEELAERLGRLRLPDDGYASYSLAAIQKLLPHLERGLVVMGRDEADSALHAAGYLRPDERSIQQVTFLPAPSEEIRNPLVQQALFEVRKLVNAVIREYGRPDRIHVELAREVQGGARRRAEIITRNRERERRRDGAAQEIRSWGQNPSREAIDRVLLWHEQGERCLYSGHAISPSQLLGGEVDVDHILPRRRSLDNSMANKVLCFRAENLSKGDRTPAEWLEEADPKAFEAILHRARSLPIDVRDGKRHKIRAREVRLDDFIHRQLTDTAYITTQVRQYVSRLGVPVVCVKGQCTAEVRHRWGLDTVLRSDDVKRKNRDDHRHHAIDALVIALTDHARLQSLARVFAMRRDEHRLPAPGDAVLDRVFPMPWESFRDEVERHVGSMLVSHRAVRDLNGPLHEETNYGRTAKPERATGDPRPHARDWIEADNQYVYRKPLDSLTLAEVKRIRDPRIRELVNDRLRAHGIDPEVKSDKPIPGSVWKEPLCVLARGARPGDTKAAEIKKVRLVKREESIVPIRTGARAVWVKPGNTHHIAIFELPGSTPEKPRRDMIAVTMIEAAQRARRGEPLVRRTHPTIPAARFLFSLSRGECILGSLQGREDLYCYRTAASTTGQMSFRSHTDARPGDKAKKYSAQANTLMGQKVLIDVLGRCRRAND
jgi:CRISPR-associated endonuclease Csn1